MSEYFRGYLVEAAPEVTWLHVEDVGSYQGDVYAVGRYDGKWLVFHDYFGSCSGCGGWGEGGEPEDLTAVLDSSELFDTKEQALAFAQQTYNELSEEFFAAFEAEDKA